MAYLPPPLWVTRWTSTIPWGRLDKVYSHKSIAKQFDCPTICHLMSLSHAYIQNKIPMLLFMSRNKTPLVMFIFRIKSPSAVYVQNKTLKSCCLYLEYKPLSHAVVYIQNTNPAIFKTTHHVTSRCVIQCHLMSRCPTPCCIMPHYVALSHVMSCYATTYHAIPYHTMPHYLTSYCPTPHHVELSHAMLCHVMSHHIVSIHAVSHRSVSCRVISRCVPYPRVMQHHTMPRHVMP